MASKLWVHEPDTFFLEAAREISEKWNFFVKRSVPENFGRENFSGQVPTESLRTQDSENVYERWVQQMFDPVLVGRSWVSATKWGPLAKLLLITITIIKIIILTNNCYKPLRNILLPRSLSPLKQSADLESD